MKVTRQVFLAVAISVAVVPMTGCLDNFLNGITNTKG